MLTGLDGLKGGRHAVAFFFCRFQDSPTLTAIDFLKSICAQLLVKHGQFKGLTDLYASTQPYRPPQNELLTILGNVAKNPSVVVANQHLGIEHPSQSPNTLTIIIDGLDEVPAGDLRKQYFTVLNALAELKAPQFRVVVVSQFRTAIEKPFERGLGLEAHWPDNQRRRSRH